MAHMEIYIHNEGVSWQCSVSECLLVKRHVARALIIRFVILRASVLMGAYIDKTGHVMLTLSELTSFADIGMGSRVHVHFSTILTSCVRRMVYRVPNDRYRGCGRGWAWSRR